MNKVSLIICFFALIGTVFALYGMSNGNANHDWLAFDGFVTAKQEEYLVEFAKRYQDVQYPRYQAVKGTKVFAYNGVRYETAKVVSVSGQNLDLISIPDKLGFKTTIDRVWFNYNHFECLKIAMEATVGFRGAYWVDSSAFDNGVSNEDFITLHGFYASHHFPIKDTYARAAVYLICLRYSQDSYRSYGISKLGMTRGFFGRLLSTAAYEWTCPEAPEKRRTFADIMSTERRDVLCWNFVEDVRDLACLVKHSNIADAKGDTINYYIHGLAGDNTVAKYGPVAATLIDGSSLVPPILKDNPDYVSPGVAKSGAKPSSCIHSPATKYVFNNRPSQTEVNDAAVLATSPNAAKLVIHGDSKVNLLGSFYDYKKMSVEYEENERLLTVAGTTALKQKLIGDGDSREVAPGTPFGFQDGNSVIVEFPTTDGSPKKSTSGSSLASFMTLSAYSIMKGYEALDYSAATLQNSVYDLMEKTIHYAGERIAFPLRILYNAIAAARVALSEGMYRIAKRWGICPEEKSREYCICGVIEPLLETIDGVRENKDAIFNVAEIAGPEQVAKKIVEDDGQSQPIAPYEDNRAITLLIGSSLSIDISFGLYVTIQWRDHGVAKMSFDMGGFAGGVKSESYGTEKVSIGVSAGFSIGLYFGLVTEINKERIGINFGVKVGGEVTIGVELLFRKAYTLDEVVSCGPLDPEKLTGAALRLLHFPASPACIRGFSVSVNVGVGVSAVAVSANFYTVSSATKSISFVNWEKEKGWNSEIKKKVDVVRKAMQLDLLLENEINYLEEEESDFNSHLLY